MGAYSEGWLTVPGKGRRWRTADGQYLLEQPQSATPQGLWAQADRALGGWLPGGGTASPVTQAVGPVVRRIQGSRELQDLVGGFTPMALSNLHTAIGQTLVNRMFGSEAPGAKLSGEEAKVLKTFNRLNPRAMVAPPGTPGVVTPLLSGYPSFHPNMHGPGADVVKIRSGAPSWILAHELGHLEDIRLRNPGSPAVQTQLARFMEDQQLQARPAAMRGSNAALRVQSPYILNAAAGSDRDRSLLQAAGEGILANFAYEYPSLRSEVMADVYGSRLAKRAGTPWSWPESLAAKGTHVTATAARGAGQGLIGEAVNRSAEFLSKLGGGVIDAGVRRWRGGKDTPQQASLRQWGYDPAGWEMGPGPTGAWPGNPTAVRLQPRSDAGRAGYQFVQQAGR